MSTFIANARIHVSGTDVTTPEEATAWITQAQLLINHMDDKYGKDIMVDIVFDTPTRRSL